MTYNPNPDKMNYWNNRKVLVTGGAGFLGKTLVPKIESLGARVFVPRSKEFDLTKENDIDKLFKQFTPQTVIHLAADVGGIEYMRSNPAKIYFHNIIMSTLLLEKARQYKVDKFVGVNTVNCYPENAHMPLREDSLWDGKPEDNVAPYGLAKRMMIFQSEVYRKQHDFNSINLILENTYGPLDNFDLSTSRVIPAVIRKCAEAKKENKNNISIWGTGKATREFLYVEDAAEAIILATERYNKPEPVNIGAGSEISIKDLVRLIANLIGFNGKIIWDTSKPEGQLRRRLDITKAHKELSFKAKTPLEEGLRKTITWYTTTGTKRNLNNLNTPHGTTSCR